MLDLGKVKSQFEIVHPKAEVEPDYEGVVFYTEPLPSDVSFKLYEASKKKGGKIDSRFIVDTFVRILKDWDGVVRDGVDVPCNEQEKRAFFSNPATNKLAQYIIDRTDEMSREEHNIVEGN
jgi:hypothetical protein